MENNIISGIMNIVKFRINNLKDYATKSHIKINAVGDQLEFYVKDAISGSFEKKDKQKEEEHKMVFSYLGNQNNPPDMIIREGDAFEIKKIENKSSAIALNSSPPKDRLYSSDERITNACKDCEDKEWDKKDLFYVIGHTKDRLIKYLFFIQGTCYAAKKEIYENIHIPLKEEIDDLLKKKKVEIGKTRELGKVKKADPLGITNLRIRGMWHIENPIKVYADFCKLDEGKAFSLFAIMDKSKYNSFPEKDIKQLEKTKGVNVSDIKIKAPNNPKKLIGVKLVYFCF